MIRNQLLLKSIAIYFIVSMFTSILMPPLAQALTSGPTAPEYSSFEPIDATDMVNLANGDFVYNIPLLEVPGPEGGYPVSLSYHAGISPELEASWVGLGWTLNAGAINRMVNGYPDDFRGVTQSVTDYWDGGESKTFSVGVGYNGVSVGLTFANDTYKGSGVGMSMGIGIPSTIANIGVSTGPYGGYTVSAGVTMGTNEGAVRGSVSMGIAYNSESNSISTYGSGGLSLSGKLWDKGARASLIGISLSSSNTQPGLSILGTSTAATNSNAGNMTVKTLSNSATIPIPTPVGLFSLSLGSSWTRYYMYQSDFNKVYGALYPNHTPKLRPYRSDENIEGKTEFDCFTFIDPKVANYSESDPDKEMGGSMPAYDSYNVTAQGLSGMMQPYIYRFANMYRGNNDKTAFETEQYNYSRERQKAQFKFTNEFSNALVRTPFFEDGASLAELLAQDGDGRVAIGKKGLPFSASVDAFEDYNPYTEHLAGKQHIEWFSNQEIAEGTAQKFGFMDFDIDPSIREVFFVDGGGTACNDDGGFCSNIGGFAITNASGVTFHYALPVYEYGDYSYSKHKGNKSFREQLKGIPYAYTWLLTGITGPDFVDRGGSNNDPNGVIDDNDWGYWVKFDYGIWTNRFLWRNPHSGVHKDLDNEVETYSSGRKQLYYLNSIRTRTHTALFIKDIRKDNKGVKTDTRTTVNEDNKIKIIPSSGGFGYTKDGEKYSELSTASMRLDRILLFTNDKLRKAVIDADVDSPCLFGEHAITVDYDGIACASDALHHVIPTSDNVLPTTVHYGKYVIDVHDIAELDRPKTTEEEADKFSKAAIREIIFHQDYELCKNTPNSLDLDYNNLSASNVANKGGKLTLQSLEYNGYQQYRSLPPTKFEYKTGFTDSNGDFVAYTYDRYKTDAWQSYKHDFPSNSSDRHKYPRYTTNESSKHIDAWCLKKISTPIGAEIEIEYEADRYTTSVLSPKRNFAISQAEALANNQVKFTLYQTEDIAYIKELEIGRKIAIAGILRFLTSAKSTNTQTSCNIALNRYAWESFDFSQLNIVATEGTDQFIVESKDLYDAITQLKSRTSCNGTSEQPFELFMGGNIIAERVGETLGGGHRVANISLAFDDKKHTTYYDYENGTTAYEPFDFNIVLQRVEDLAEKEEDQEKEEKRVIREYKQKFFQQFAEIFANKQILPSPGVLYKNISTHDHVLNLKDNTVHKVPAKAKYEYIVFDENSYLREDSQCEDCQTNDGRRFKMIKFKNLSNKVGMLKSVSHWKVTQNQQGEEEESILDQTTTHYLHEQEGDYADNLEHFANNQGRLDQLYFEKRKYNKDHEKTNDDGEKKYTHWDRQLMLTKLEDYPVIPVSTTTIDYVKEITGEQHNLAFDFYTGTPTVTVKQNTNGDYFLSKITPAYQLRNDDHSLVYDQMGFKIFDDTLVRTNGDKNAEQMVPLLNRQMLEQNASTEIFKVGLNAGSTKPYQEADFSTRAIVSAEAQTWSDAVPVLLDIDPTAQGKHFEKGNQYGIWRKHKHWNYVHALNQERLSEAEVLAQYQAASFQSWNNTLSPSMHWQESNALTLYDVYTHGLEAKDLNGHFAATKLDPRQEYIIASASNSNYDEMAYAGAEFMTNNTWKEGGVERNQGQASLDFAHTGTYSLQVNSGEQGFGYSFEPKAGQKYYASVWVYLPGFTQDDENLDNVQLKVRYKDAAGNLIKEEATHRTLGLSAQNYHLISTYILANEPTASIEVVCENTEGPRDVYFDDFRVHPLGAKMTSYVYDQDRGLLSYILGTNNLYTRFEYDHAGKLKATYQEILGNREKIVSKQKMHYGKIYED